MKAKIGTPTPLNILGDGNSASIRESLSAILRLWRQKLRYYSVFASLPAILASNAQEGLADEVKKPEVSVAGQTAKHFRKRNKNIRLPELLRRQSNYVLPQQREKLGMVSEITGGDDCPGAAIPNGGYTAAAPFTDTGDTVGANNTVTFLVSYCHYYYNCYGFNENGPDLTYSFTLTSREGSPEIRVTPTTETFNPAIYVLDGRNGCPAGTGNWAWSPLAVSDSSGPGGAETLSAKGLPLDVPLHLFVDSNESGNSGPYTLRIQDVTIASRPRTGFDFDGDGRADEAIWRPSDGKWWVKRSTGEWGSTPWGDAADEIVPGDYDGDGKSDMAVWRPSSGEWFVINSNGVATPRRVWGVAGDIPVQGNFDDDGKTDPAIWRPTTGEWWIYNSGGGSRSRAWGQVGDVPVPADYDGDGKTDLAIWRPTSGEWWILRSDGSHYSKAWGQTGDMAVPADYDGDGKADLAVWRPSEGKWYIIQSSGDGRELTWGIAGDIPVPGDYDGDGMDDPSIWRPSDGKWYMFRSAEGIGTTLWGVNGDMPIPKK